MIDAVRLTTEMIVPPFYDRGIMSVGIDLKQDRITMIAEMIERWMQRSGLSQAKKIVDTSRKQINEIIEAGVRDGEGAEGIARNIRKFASGSISTVRARLIARTETHNAALFSNQEAAKSTGMELLKKWVSTEDGRVRPDHASVDNRGYIPMDQAYIVGGKRMMRPGDPAGGAEQIINCRCAEVYKPVNSVFDDE